MEKNINRLILYYDTIEHIQSRFFGLFSNGLDGSSDLALFFVPVASSFFTISSNVSTLRMAIGLPFSLSCMKQLFEPIQQEWIIFSLAAFQPAAIIRPK